MESPDVRLVREGERSRLVLTGPIDIHFASAITTLATQALADKPAGLDIDLRAVTFLDSGGIGSLVAVKNAAMDAGYETVRVYPGPANVMRVFEIVGLGDVFEVLA